MEMINALQKAWSGTIKKNRPIVSLSIDRSVFDDCMDAFDESMISPLSAPLF